MAATDAYQGEVLLWEPFLLIEPHVAMYDSEERMVSTAPKASRLSHGNEQRRKVGNAGREKKDGKGPSTELIGGIRIW